MPDLVSAILIASPPNRSSRRSASADPTRRARSKG